MICIMIFILGIEKLKKGDENNENYVCVYFFIYILWEIYNLNKILLLYC